MLNLDTQKLKDFPGVDLALGWINAAHDYDCILEIERVLREQKGNNEELQLPENYSFYFVRLRSAQTREAIGLCEKTKKVPQLCALIDRDSEAVACFDRLCSMHLQGCSNHDMETIRLIRDTTFHYCMRQHADWYRQVFDELITQGRTMLPVDAETPNRFSPADQLLSRLFLKQALQMPNLDDYAACGVRMRQAAELLVRVGYDFQVVARALGRGLIEVCRC